MFYDRPSKKCLTYKRELLKKLFLFFNLPTCIPGRLLFTRVSQELVRQILRKMKYNYGWLFSLKFYGPVNSSGQVEPISHPLTLLLGRIRQTKRLTSTLRAYARGNN